MLRVLFTIKIIVVCLCFTFSANGRGEAAEIIVVTAAQLGLPKSAIGSTVTVITAEDIQKRGLIYAGDILRQVPGVAVSRSGTWGTVTNIRVRGAEANHTQVLIDGIEVNDPAIDSAFNLGSLTLDNMERIEIIRGPQSALSGSDAIGAVVNFITRKGRGAGSLSGSVEVGGRDTLKAAIGGNFANDYFNYNINAEVLGTDGFNIARGAGEDDGHDNRSYDLNLGVTPFEALHLELVARHVDSDTDTDPQPSSRVVDGAGDGTLVDQTYWSTRMQWSLLDNRWRHRFQADTTETRNGFRSAAFGFSSTRGRREKYAYQTGFSFATPALSHNPSFLFEYQDDSATGTFIGGGSEVSFISKSYAGEYHLGVFDRLFITAGARFDDNEFFDGAETYRITGAYNHKAGNMRFHTSYGTGIKNPTLTELFSNRPNFTGNPDLKPESVKGWDLGIERTWMDQRLRVDLIYFHNTITDRITGFNDTAVNITGNNRIYGVEMLADFELATNLSLAGSYTYTRAKDADGRESIRRARHIASLNLNYALIDNRANINLGVHYNGEQQDTVFLPFPMSPARTTLDGFTLVNLNASYRINDALTTYLRVENLLDEGYEEVYSYRAPGINGFLGLKLNFNR